MQVKNSPEQTKMIALFIFVPAVISLGKGIGGLDDGLNFAETLMIVGGLGGAILAAYSFFKAK